MKDWDDLLDVDPDEYRENPEEETQEQEKHLATSENAKIKKDVEKVKVSEEFPEEVQEKAKDNFRRTVGGQTLIDSGACQPESDGDITCKFELGGPTKVKVTRQKPGAMMGQTEEVTVPVNPEGTVTAEDFDEARAHDTNKIKPGRDITVVS